MEGVMIIREEDIGLYKCTKRQRNSVEMATSMTDALELREGRAEDMYNAAFKALLASSNDAPQDFVLTTFVGDVDGAPSSGCL